MLRRRLSILLIPLLLTSCVVSMSSENVPPTPAIWVEGQTTAAAAGPSSPTLSFSMPATRLPGGPISTPTPNPPNYQAEAGHGGETYVVQPGDMLSAIAEKYGVSLDALAQANNIANVNALEVGQRLTIPEVAAQPTGPSFKLIPDSELVYGPLSSQFDIEAFIQEKGGYLADYTEVVDGETLTAAQIIQRVAQNFSVNPRLLLAVLEYRSRWVTDPAPDAASNEMPIGAIDNFYVGLYRQLVWTVCHLNNGYYRWRSGAATNWVLKDDAIVPVNPTINAGTAGVQNLFAQLDDYTAWLHDVSPGGFFDTYQSLFGYPFDLAIEPLVPANLTQPPMLLPFGEGEIWAFTGGPHSTWDFGSPLGALDFAPPGEAQGCVEVDYWVTAVADGLVLHTGDGVVLQDLDGDGNEGSGWVVLYMHVESRDRVQPGTYLQAGEQVGHPSCEGGQSSGTHVHLARKFNGEWISAIGSTPFNLSGWVSAGTGEEYVGTLTRDGIVVENYEGNDPINQIQR